MNAPDQDPNNETLAALLRAARPVAGLPPRFQENVWQRIEHAPQTTASNWVATLAAMILRPRFALALISVLVLIGAALGSLNGTSHARHDAQERYVAAVAIPAH